MTPEEIKKMLEKQEQRFKEALSRSQKDLEGIENWTAAQRDDFIKAFNGKQVTEALARAAEDVKQAEAQMQKLAAQGTFDFQENAQKQLIQFTRSIQSDTREILKRLGIENSND
ncbi:hypothetical protein H6F86_00535 [Phormidium sp. FACHB-592]|uniref:Uncharacterized protein n=1 Tax=Stenomitos frigidus AS-A4 TaxID=2933935 RepID=A0ABV0KSZ8_9CYAN|nr:hypothetical protein [Phormidium sp. FACHB-592]MBD2072421.1 hypothetical protein [Phormidium sp. FACHB-592]